MDIRGVDVSLKDMNVSAVWGWNRRCGWVLSVIRISVPVNHLRLRVVRIYWDVRSRK